MPRESAKIRIYNAVLDLLQIQPMEKIHIQELIKKAGVSRNTYYYYFYSIENVLSCMTDDFFDKFSEYMNKLNSMQNSTSVAEKKDSPYFVLLLAFWQFVYDSKKLIYIIYNQNRGNEFMLRFIKCTQESFKLTIFHMRCLKSEEPEYILPFDKFYDYYINQSCFDYYSTFHTWMSHNFWIRWRMLLIIIFMDTMSIPIIPTAFMIPLIQIENSFWGYCVR